jgi:hypothetical protein
MPTGMATSPQYDGLERNKSEVIADVSNEERSTGEGNTSEILIDPKIEKQVLRRLDKRFAPLFCALYFFGKFPVLEHTYT